MGGTRAWVGIPVRDRLPDGETAVLHSPRPRLAGLLQWLRPAVPRPGAGHRRAAAAPAYRLSGRAGGPWRGPGALRGVLAGLRARHAAARRLRDRPGTLDRSADGRGQHPSGHPVSPRPAPAQSVTASLEPAVWAASAAARPDPNARTS